MSEISSRPPASFIGNAPASPDAIREAEASLGVRLPESYRGFLLRMDGGEGSIGGLYVRLWRVGELKEMEDGYGVKEYLPGYLLFGSDGGGEAFAFDMRTANRSIVMVPFVVLDTDAAEPLGMDFDSFLDASSHQS